MSELSGFNDEERHLLMSLPYKVGVYISEADDAEGTLDDDKELQALLECIRKIATSYSDSGLVDGIIRGTLKLDSQWESWGKTAYNLEPDCQAAIALLLAKGTRQDAENYREALILIANTVAQTYGEFIALDDGFEEKKSFFSALTQKIINRITELKDDEGHPSNVSAAEHSAVSRLAAALKIPA